MKLKGEPWTEMVLGETIYHLCTYEIEGPEDERNLLDRTYKIDIAENQTWKQAQQEGLDDIEQDLHYAFKKQNIFNCKEKSLRIELSTEYKDSWSFQKEKKTYYIPKWMCKKIHDWYKENYKKV